jgi:NAD(P)-dependent dehydrogenase (short-subunit alcohol dehydrogenase family)
MSRRFLLTSVTSPEDCRKLADEIVRWAGRIDVLYNNGGIDISKRVEDYSLEE